MASKQRTTPARATGVIMIHSKACGLHSEWTFAGCSCQPSYRAQVFDKVTRRRQAKTFKDLKSVVRWHADRQAALRAGKERVVEGVTLAALYAEWRQGVAYGTVTARGQRAYKQSTLRESDGIWRMWLEPALGHVKVRELRTLHIQTTVNTLVRAGTHQPATIGNRLNVLRVLLNYAIATERYDGANPCTGVRLPSIRETEKEIVAPEVAVQLVRAIPDLRDRALLATAFFAGLRRGELQGLRWGDVDLAARTIKVQRSFDRAIARTPEAERNPTIVGWPAVGGGAYTEVKTRSGKRTLGIPQVLLAHLAELEIAAMAAPGDHRERSVFPSSTTATEHFDAVGLMNRVRAAWKGAGLGAHTHLSLHGCRHTYASTLIAAGLNIKKVSTYMGHSKVAITWDRYGHLYPDIVGEDMGLLDAHLAERIGA